jgi:hypothetical protein
MRALLDRMNALTMEDSIVWGLVLAVALGIALGDVGIWIAIGLTLAIAVAADARVGEELAVE